jgi:hypothetical protein
MRRAWSSRAHSLRGWARVVKLPKSSKVAMRKVRRSRGVHSVEAQGRQFGGLGSQGGTAWELEGGKIAEEVEGSNADSMGLEGTQLESLRVVKFPRSYADGVELKVYSLGARGWWIHWGELAWKSVVAESGSKLNSNWRVR